MASKVFLISKNDKVWNEFACNIAAFTSFFCQSSTVIDYDKNYPEKVLNDGCLGLKQ